MLPSVPRFFVGGLCRCGKSYPRVSVLQAKASWIGVPSYFPAGGLARSFKVRSATSKDEGDDVSSQVYQDIWTKSELLIKQGNVKAADKWYIPLRAHLRFLLAAYVSPNGSMYVLQVEFYPGCST